MPGSTADEASLSFPSLEFGASAGQIILVVPAEVGKGSPLRSAGSPAPTIIPKEDMTMASITRRKFLAATGVTAGAVVGAGAPAWVLVRPIRCMASAEK